MEEILSSIRRIIADEEAEDDHSEDDELGAAEAESEALNEDADALARAAGDEHRIPAYCQGSQPGDPKPKDQKEPGPPEVSGPVDPF